MATRIKGTRHGKKRGLCGAGAVSKVSGSLILSYSTRTDLHGYSFIHVPTRLSINNGSHLSTSNVFVWMQAT